MKKDFHFLWLLLLACPGWAQISLQDVDYSEAIKKGVVADPTPTPQKKIKTVSRAGQMNQIENDDDGLVREQIRNRKQLQQGLESLNKKLEASNGKVDPQELLKSLGGGGDVAKLMKNNQMVKVMLQHMKNTPEKEIEKIFINSPSPFSKAIFKNFPKLATFMAKIMKDDKAIKGLMSMMTEKKKRKTYVLFLASMLVVFFLISLFTGKNLTVFGKLKRKILMSLTFFAINIGGLLFFYGKELTPTIQVAKKVFL